MELVWTWSKGKEILIMDALWALAVDCRIEFQEDQIDTVGHT
jgi:hypothetical protein